MHASYQMQSLLNATFPQIAGHYWHSLLRVWYFSWSDEYIGLLLVFQETRIAFTTSNECAT